MNLHCGFIWVLKTDESPFCLMELPNVNFSRAERIENQKIHFLIFYAEAKEKSSTFYRLPPLACLMVS